MFPHLTPFFDSIVPPLFPPLSTTPLPSSAYSSLQKRTQPIRSDFYCFPYLLALGFCLGFSYSCKGSFPVCLHEDPSFGDSFPFSLNAHIKTWFLRAIRTAYVQCCEAIPPRPHELANFFSIFARLLFMFFSSLSPHFVSQNYRLFSYFLRMSFQRRPPPNYLFHSSSPAVLHAPEKSRVAPFFSTLPTDFSSPPSKSYSFSDHFSSAA